MRCSEESVSLITPQLSVCFSVLCNWQACIVILVPDSTLLLHSEMVPQERSRTERLLGCYPSPGLPFIRRHPASLSCFLQMKFLSHHQGEARAAWTSYATSGKRKQICKLNRLLIGIVGSHQLLISTSVRTKLHGLTESRIVLQWITSGHRIKLLKCILETFFFLS